MAGRLEGRVAVVTGGGHGIGCLLRQHRYSESELSRAVGDADVKVDADIVAPDSKLAGGVVWAPHFDSLERADLLPVLLELLVDRAFYLAIARAGA